MVIDQITKKQFRTHTESTLKDYTFLCFFALILFIETQQKLGGLNSFQDVLRRAKNLHCRIFENDVIVSECQH